MQQPDGIPTSQWIGLRDKITGLSDMIFMGKSPWFPVKISP